MRKNFLILMLMTLLPLAGFAQRNVNDVFPAGNYVYQVTAVMDGTLPGEVTLIGIRDGKTPIVDGALVIPGLMTATLFDEDYSFNVTALGANALQQRMNASGVVQGSFTETAAATTVEFPAPIKTLPANCLKGYTNISSISFAEDSELETIADGAFATTQITTFDFSNCSNLAALTNAVFVEDAPATNSFITSITLPENSVLLKQIGTAFQRLTELTEIVNLEKSAITEVVANAFSGDAKLTKIELPGTVQTIAANAFANCGVSDLTINVGSLITAGNSTTQLYGTTPADLAKLTKLTLKGNLGGIITTNAFKGHDNLATLDLSGLNFASLGQIATSAFENCTKITSVTLGNINDQPATGCTINDDAFKGCTKLATVTVGNINSANAIGAAAFGNKLKTVTIGTVKAGAASIVAGAFVYADVSGTTLDLASATGKYLSSDNASTPIFGAAAFNFSAVTNTANAANFVGPVINIGEIKSKGGVFKGSDISLPAAATYNKSQAKLNFVGNIAEGGIDANIIDNKEKVDAITFSGNIATGGIELNAFANYDDQKMTITFSGSLANHAVADGAFNGLYSNATDANTSKVVLSGTPADATVNPFEIRAFDNTTDISGKTDVAGVDEVILRQILLEIAETHPLYAQYKSATKGLLTYDGTFAIYRVKFYVAPVPADNTFLAYQNANQKSAAWARINFSTDKLSETLNGGTKHLKIQRYQKVKDGDTEVDAKLTLYATYTDEDDAEKVSTIYMVPLKVYDGYYELAKTDNEVIIAKVAKLSGDFTNTDIKVPVTTSDAALTNESLWTGLTNTELHIAQNVMTNQQLIDKTASDGVTPVDIYRTGEGAEYDGKTIAEDLYVMTDPTKYGGFEIKKIVITRGTGGKGAYIGEGWYYMLLKHYAAAAAAPAHVIWMDADPETDPNTTGIFEMKHSVKENVKSNAIYTLQGVRVSAPVKGQIYIQNGKKFIAK